MGATCSAYRLRLSEHHRSRSGAFAQLQGGETELETYRWSQSAHFHDLRSAERPEDGEFNHGWDRIRPDGEGEGERIWRFRRGGLKLIDSAGFRSASHHSSGRGLAWKSQPVPDTSPLGPSSLSFPIQAHPLPSVVKLKNPLPKNLIAKPVEICKIILCYAVRAGRLV